MSVTALVLKMAHLCCRFRAREEKDKYEVVVDVPDVRETIQRRDA